MELKEQLQKFRNIVDESLEDETNKFQKSIDQTNKDFINYKTALRKPKPKKTEVEERVDEDTDSYLTYESVLNQAGFRHGFDVNNKGHNSFSGRHEGQLYHNPHHRLNVIIHPEGNWTAEDYDMECWANGDNARELKEFIERL